MPNLAILTGNRYGRLLVLSRADNQGKRTLWKCLCLCGNLKSVLGSSLVRGLTQSCGCLHKEKARELRLVPVDRRRKFGKLRVLAGPVKKGSKTYYTCLCDCGVFTQVESYTLRQGFTKSCGCLQKEAITTHGKSQTKEYKAAKSSERRAILYSLQEHYTTEDVENKFIEQKGMCFYCSIDLHTSGFHREHMVPLSRRGTNSPENLCLSCPDCNLRKSRKTADEFLACQKQL